MGHLHIRQFGIQLGPDHGMLRVVEEVDQPIQVGVVFDPERASGVRIALAARLVNCLVTHRADAEALLQL